MSSVNGVSSLNAMISGSTQAAEIKKSASETASFKSALEKAQANKDDKALMEVCQQFESIFVNMMFDTMKQANLSEDDEDAYIQKSFGRDIFEDMRDEEISKKVASAGGIGIAKVMYNQLKKYNEAVEVAPETTIDVKK